MKQNRATMPRKIQVICLPFSGGSGFGFQPLANYYPKFWEVITITYPGRGQRMAEPLLRSMKALVKDSWQQIKAQLQPPYILFGHSLGSTLAYLLAQEAKKEGYPLPLHLFLSGTGGPSVPPVVPYRYLFTKEKFKAKLKSYGGISNEILEDEEAFSFFEPIIRADFEIVETWQYQEQTPLTIPATIITGTEEDLTEREIQLWQKEFNNTVNFRKMQGNHFFLFEQPELFIQLIQTDLARTIAKPKLTTTLVNRN